MNDLFDDSPSGTSSRHHMPDDIRTSHGHAARRQSLFAANQKPLTNE